MSTQTTEAAIPSGTNNMGSSHCVLKERVEDFLAYEGDLLDTRQFDSWLELLDEDIRYWMPITQNFEHNKPESEYSREQQDGAWFDEGKVTLEQRIKQIQGGDHWAEEPLSRTTHMITNIRLTSVTETAVTVKSRFLVYVNRREEEVRLFVGKRIDILKPNGDSFLITRRSIFLDQSKLLAKNLTTFF